MKTIKIAKEFQERLKNIGGIDLSRFEYKVDDKDFISIFHTPITRSDIVGLVDLLDLFPSAQLEVVNGLQQLRMPIEEVRKGMVKWMESNEVPFALSGVAEAVVKSVSIPSLSTIPTMIEFSTALNNVVTTINKQEGPSNYDLGIFEMATVEAATFTNSLNKLGIKTSILDYDSEEIPPIDIVNRAPGNWIQVRNQATLWNDPIQSNFVDNRYWFLQFMKGKVNIPETYYFSNDMEVAAFLATNSKRTFAVKEYVHRGGGRTTIKLQGDPNHIARAALLRMETLYPLIVQEWLPHDPRKDFLRVITVGDEVFGKRSADPGTHAQEGLKWHRIKKVPDEVRDQGILLNEKLKLTFNSTDYIRSRGMWYVIDVHGERTDTFDWPKLYPEKYIEAWAKLIRG